jgi:hypothetical protein
MLYMNRLVKWRHVAVVHSLVAGDAAYGAPVTAHCGLFVRTLDKYNQPHRHGYRSELMYLEASVVELLQLQLLY